MDAAEVVAMLRSPGDAAVLGAALEVGLFWAANEAPLDAKAVERKLGVPESLADHWLRLLASVGFLEQSPDGFVPSERCRCAILESYSQATWALLAQEAREALAALVDLPDALRGQPSSRGQVPYVDRMRVDAERARRFTRMLYELHEPLAAAMAEALDLRGVRRLMDLGGGSGVVSMALLRHWSQMTATVVDIEAVCAAGRELARETGFDKRLQFHSADFVREPLPGGFDAVLECDVGVYSLVLFTKVRQALDPGGRFLIADEFAPPGGFIERDRLRWAFQRSLADPAFIPPELDTIGTWLAAAGFRLAPGGPKRVGDTTILEAVSA